MLDSTITSKGQVTIPLALRNSLGLKAGDKIQFVRKGDEITLRRKKKYTLEDLFGCLPKPKRALTIEEMNQGVIDAVAARYERSLPKRRKKAKK